MDYYSQRLSEDLTRFEMLSRSIALAVVEIDWVAHCSLQGWKKRYMSVVV